MGSPLWIVLFDGLLLLAVGLFGASGRFVLSMSILASTAVLAVWQWIVFDSLRSTAQSARVESNIKQPHYIQAILQVCLYVYWGLYWDEVWAYLPLILVQILFAYAVEMLLSFSRSRVWHVGFGPVPIVLSINLFLWFRDEYFFLQFALILLVYFGKEFVRWDRGGRRTHIFNPSAFALALVALLLLATDKFELSRGTDIIEAFDLPPNIFETIFLLGVVIQLLYQTTLVTLGAVLAQTLLFQLAVVVVGVPINRIPIEVSVFLGLTLLVTDPSTSPRTRMGKFLFGVTYGAGIFVLFVGLRLIHQPSFVDKILMVPVVNLLVPWFDRVGAWCHSRVERMTWLPALRWERFVWVLLYACVFANILPPLKNPVAAPEHPALPPPAGGISRSQTLNQLLGHRDFCQQILPAPYQPFGYRSEISSFHKIKDIYRNGTASRFVIDD